MNSAQQSTFTHLCHQIGSRVPLWTQGVGGNISFKNGDILWVKASGYRLQDISPSFGIAAVSISKFRQKISAKVLSDDLEMENIYSELIGEYSETSLRPSMETGFHLLLPKKFILHFHSIVSLLLAHHSDNDADRFRKWIEKYWKNGLVRVLPILRPGWALAEVASFNTDASVLILKNHGIILQDDSPQVLNQWEDLERKFCSDWGYPSLIQFYENLIPYQSIPTPLKIYFPDAVLVVENLKKHLVPVSEENGRFVLPPEIAQKDRNCFEIWYATQILFALCPSLAEIPVELQESILNLPAEKLRQKMMQMNVKD